MLKKNIVNISVVVSYGFCCIWTYSFNLMVPVEALWKTVGSPMSQSLLIINSFSLLFETFLENLS